jgi:hypothetical protein
LISLVLIFSSIVLPDFINEEDDFEIYKNCKQEVNYGKGKIDSLDKPKLMDIVL